MTTPNAAQLVEQHQKIKAYVATQTDAFQAAIKPYLDGMEAIENKILEMLNTTGSDNFKTEFGTAYKSELMNVKVVERDKLIDFAMDNWDTIGSDLLNVGASKPAVAQWLKSSGGKLPPGIEVTYFTRVNIRKS